MVLTNQLLQRQSSAMAQCRRPNALLCFLIPRFVLVAMSMPQVRQRAVLASLMCLSTHAGSLSMTEAAWPGYRYSRHADSGYALVGCSSMLGAQHGARGHSRWSLPLQWWGTADSKIGVHSFGLLDAHMYLGQ
jgi:hypothetical protein